MNNIRYPGPLAGNRPAICLAGLDWPQLWSRVQGPLRAEGYTIGTLRTYRHVLRSFSRWFYSTPERVTARAVKAYILALTDRHCSWSWTSTNISVLRTVFDHLSGMSVCASLVTPKRPQHLPHIIGRPDILRILTAADTPRDQLLLGLLYGCGLKVAEVCALKWADIDTVNSQMRVGTGRTARSVAIPTRLLPLLARGVAICAATDHVFRGNRAGAHLSPRMAEYVLRKAATLAAIDTPACCMTLRHSYAVHSLQDGATIREVQYALGLRSIHSAMLYLRCLVPAGAVSPLTTIEAALPELGPDIPVALPFEPPDLSIGERIRLFYRSLRLHVKARYLSFRHAIGGD